jgi:integrase
MGNLWGAFFRICILTGQRSRKDILEMRWSWIDFERCRYEIPNPKNGRPHIVHLSAPAIKELLNLQGLQSDNSTIFVFTTTGRRAASGVSKAKLKLDNHIHGIWGKAGHQLPFEPWVLHDLRRAQATALAEAGFDESVVDRIQNHVATGSRASAVAAVYNKAQKLTERAAALDAWANMVTGENNNVIQLKEA